MPAGQRTRSGSIVLLVVGIALSIFGFTLTAAGAAASWFATAQSDGEFFTSPTERYTVSSYALVSPQLYAFGEGTPERLPFDIGTLRLRATAADPGRDVFIGIAANEDVEEYLEGIQHTVLQEVKFRPFRPGYREVAASSTPALPSLQKFWAASASGPGQQEVTWNLTAGNWTVVVMNAEATPGVSAGLQAGFRSELIKPAATSMLLVGVLALIVGLPLLIAGAARIGRHHGPLGPVQSSGVKPTRRPSPAPETTGASSYPLHIAGHLDPAISPWMWLVKWFLAVPHYFVLFFLWFAFAITSIFAWFSILFTGRYPQSLFHFNVGVLRWNWRVAFYAYAAAGTDRYPPFTLARTDYPADLDVDYPQRLSRGLVLTKSWFLLLPHLLIVASFTGAATRLWEVRSGSGVVDDRGGGLSLMGLLVLTAVLILLFTGRYPQSLFALIMGINRWIYRVLAYGALMRDEYPPFRLDQGATDPDQMVPHSAALVPIDAPTVKR